MRENNIAAILKLSGTEKQSRLESLLRQMHRDTSSGKLFVWVREKIPELRDGPLSGLGFVVKDSLELKDSPLCFGTRRALIERSAESAALVQLLEEAGASCLAKCSLDEACLNFFGDNPHSGKIINPIDPARFPGGSSGSVAVAVQRGLADFGLGSDFGGSTRIPAAACNLVGLKFGSETFARDGAFLYDQNLDSYGVLSRNLSDLKILLEASLPAQKQYQIRTLLIPSEQDLELVDAALRQHFKSLCRQLKRHFEIQELPSGLFSKAKVLRKALALKQIERKFEDWRIDISSLSEDLQAQYHYAKLQSETPAKMFESQIASLQDLFRNPRCTLLTPTLSQAMPERLKVTAIKQFQESGPLFLYLANLLGFPALSFPLKGSHLQLVSAKGSERKLWELANYFEDLSTELDR